MEELSWKPQRQGHVYCSPACSCGCLYESYVDRKRMADKLAADLGEGWRPRVWENIGWHAAVDFGGTPGRPLMSLHIRKGAVGKVRYNMFVRVGQTNEVIAGTAPIQLVSEAVDRIAKERANLEKMLREARGALWTIKGKAVRRAAARRNA